MDKFQTRLHSEETLRVALCSAQEIGAREEQEDSLAYTDANNREFARHGGILAVLADGMGGFHAGQEASQAAVKEFQNRYLQKTPEEPIADVLMRSLFLANDAVMALPAAQEPDCNVGTTLVAVAILDRTLYWISVGDSRVYLIRNGEISQITTDHVYGGELDRKVKQKMISAEAAERHPDREILTSYVGTADLTQIDCNFRPFRLEAGDTVILCSDGLYRGLEPSEFITHLKSTPQETCRSFISAVQRKNLPNQDNMSIIAVTLSEPETSLAPQFWKATDITEEESELENEVQSLAGANRFIGGLLIATALIGIIFVLIANLKQGKTPTQNAALETSTIKK